jgi:hypothetical protein
MTRQDAATGRPDANLEGHVGPDRQGQNQPGPANDGVDHQVAVCVTQMGKAGRVALRTRQSAPDEGKFYRFCFDYLH